MIVHNYLLSNRNDEKKKAAINKILEYHPDINMEPFFKCDMQMLPFVFDWLERAHDLPVDFDADNSRYPFSLSKIYHGHVIQNRENSHGSIQGTKKRHLCCVNYLLESQAAIISEKNVEWKLPFCLIVLM